jgi:uncharacterized metal-binding protein YceD (DUF177 family)
MLAKPKYEFKNGAQMRPNHAHPSLELKHLLQNRGVDFDLTLSEADISEITEQLDLLSLRKIKFSGTILPIGKGDWELLGELGATVEQACSLTLAPVHCRIDTPVIRRFRKSPIALNHSGPEHEIPEDDSEEQLEDVIDLGRVVSEALSLALPDYPRAEGAELKSAEFAPPGVTPLTDDAARPFSVLAGLKDKLQ